VLLADRPEDNRLIALKDLEFHLRVQRSVLDKVIESIVLERSNAGPTSIEARVPPEDQPTGSRNDDPLELSSAEEELGEEEETEVGIEKTPKGSCKGKGKEREQDVGEVLFVPDLDED